MNDEMMNCIINKVGAENVKLNEPMSEHISFKVGGPAKYFITPRDISDVAFLIKTLSDSDIPYFILGNGSNVIVKDKGYEGAIILLKDKFNYIKLDYKEKSVVATVGAGVMLKNLSDELMENEIEGFEFASGIPGTIGGAIAMNAGAYGGEMKDILTGAKVITKEGETLELSKDDLEMGYRTSTISKKGHILIEAVFEFKKGKHNEIKSKIDEYTEKREEKQPLDLPSAGSTFKRPEGHFAGKLIMDSGLRGYRHGGAMVSEKHCGFVVNAGGATAEDIISLIKEVQDIVYEKQGVRLETEVRLLQ